MRILFLDDNKHRHNTFRQKAIGCVVDAAFDAQQAISFLREKKEYEMIFLDHDLDAEIEGICHEDIEDGRFVVKQMIEMELHVEMQDVAIVVHSLNGAGAAQMISMLTSAGFTNVHRVPFAWTRFTREDKQVSFPPMRGEDYRPAEESVHFADDDSE